MTEQELIERLEKATGPDRAIDALIEYWKNGNWLLMDGDSKLADLDAFRKRVLDADDSNIFVAPRYTASIDAALPGEHILSMHKSGYEWQVVAQSDDGRLHGGMSCANEAIARRIAALKARVHLRDASEQKVNSEADDQQRDLTKMETGK